jgi:hypothetical protein
MNTTVGEPFTAIPAAILPEPLESSDDYHRVLAMTERLFPGPITVRRKQDPEFREEYLAFVVGAHGTLENILSRDAQNAMAQLQRSVEIITLLAAYESDDARLRVAPRIKAYATTLGLPVQP